MVAAFFIFVRKSDTVADREQRMEGRITHDSGPDLSHDHCFQTFSVWLLFAAADHCSKSLYQHFGSDPVGRSQCFRTAERTDQGTILCLPDDYRKL